MEAIRSDEGLNAADWTVCINYGTKINTHMLWMLQDINIVYVWLDNDSQHVLNQARHIARTAELYKVKETHVIEGYDDPKHQNKEEIVKALLNG